MRFFNSLLAAGAILTAAVAIIAPGAAFPLHAASTLGGVS
jgi:hypothetical protein